MTVNIVCDRFIYWAGIGKVTYYHAKGLKELGYDVKIWTKEYNFPNTYFKHEILNLPLYKFRIFTSHLKSIKIPEDEIILSHSAVLGNYFLQNKNYFYVHHGFVPFNISKLNYFPAILEVLPQLFKAKKIISVSNYCRKQLKKMFNLDSAVIYDCIDTKFFKPLRIHKDCELCSLGRNIKRKNEKSLKELFPRLVFSEKLTDDGLVKFYNKGKIYVSLSLWESFGLYFAEAMSCGLPVVGMNHSAIPEIVGDGGVVCSSVEDLKNKVNELLSSKDLYEKISSNARNRAVENFDYRTKVKKLIKVLEMV